MQATAAGLKEAGGSVAKLTALVKDGKVSSEAFFRAFEAGAPVLQDKVAGSVFTIEHATTNLKTALIDAVKEFNESTGAGQNFAGAINTAARAINNFDVSGFIQKLRQARAEFTTFLGEVGNSSVFKKLAEGLGVLDADGNVVNVNAQAAKDEVGALEKEVKLLQERIALTTNLEIDNAPALARLAEVQTRLVAIRELAASLPATLPPGSAVSDGFAQPDDSTTNGQMGGSGSRGGARRPVAVSPVSIVDFKPPVGKSSGGGKKKKASDYAREIEQIKERTLALQAETAAQATVNPLVDDYGFASERASAAHDLLTAAQKSGLAAGKELKDVTQLLNGDFAGLSPAAREQAEAMLGLANGYATASAEAEKLAEKQASIRQAADDFKSTAKSTLSGFISDMRQGKSAAEALEGALDKVIDKLIDVALNAAFDSKSGGGLGSIFSSLFGGGGSAMPTGVGLYDKGGYTGNGGKFQPAGIVHKGEYVMDAEATKRIGVDNLRKLQGYAAGGFVGSAPSLPSLGGSRGRDHQPVDVRISVDKDGNLKAFVQRESAQVSATVVQATAPAIVNQSVSASGSALSKGKFDYGMAKYGQKRSANVG
ncbi:tape measure protein [Neorhizobium galegae]|uniref:tape measure protein n=1 Tax=Neorhizobium galegae TaxID=399 RepID=UPI001274655E|nr:tape measure protein [Neorhizobium galegae]KAA9386919.1 hypothetical protein F4V88_10775 [Neorhizobium galegae]MCM2499897.1 tape measure protein [Neorhizobium galegae]